MIIREQKRTHTHDENVTKLKSIKCARNLKEMDLIGKANCAGPRTL